MSKVVAWLQRRHLRFSRGNFGLSIGFFDTNSGEIEVGVDITLFQGWDPAIGGGCNGGFGVSLGRVRFAFEWSW